MVWTIPRGAAAMSIAWALAATHAASWADGKGAASVPMLPKYQEECGACHVAYPPGMLPAASWQRLMDGLPRHFGTDASLDAAPAKDVSAWLTSNAATRRRSMDEPPQDRITRSVWFVREHDEVGASAWQRPAVKSPANCGACHVQAQQGDFDERNVRIPR